MNACIIKVFIGDNPKRSMARDALNHASLFACEYCTAHATSHVITEKQTEIKKRQVETQLNLINQKISNLEDNPQHDKEELKNLKSIRACLTVSLKDHSKKKSQVVWPCDTRNGELRTHQKVIDIVNLIEENPDLPREQKQGIVGRSPLLDVDGFDITRDSPPEYLHSVCLGVVKRLVELTFNVGINRPRITKRKLTPITSFNALITKIKVVCEFSRRARSLDFSVWKGQEFRNLILFFFPLVIACLEDDAQEKKLWLWLAFVIRACVLPQREFNRFDSNFIDLYCSQFYKLYQKLFGVRNCTYNTHVVFSHLLQMRAHGPLTLTSAFPFEHFYGEVRNSFVPGTTSVLKQVMGKVLLKRALEHHTCKPNYYFTAHETALECNSLVYTYMHGVYEFYKITSIVEGKLHCVKIETCDVIYPCLPHLKWNTVGHFKISRITTEQKVIDPKFAGKAIQILDTLLTCPENVLNEK